MAERGDEEDHRAEDRRDPRPDGLYVLQLNADGLEDQSDIISNATDAIDSQTTISF